MSDAPDSSATFCRRATDQIAATRAVVVQDHRMESCDGDVIDATPFRSARPDPSFLTHLIAIAEHCPQTRVLRRASPQDAMAAYRAADANGHAAPIGTTTRQKI